MRTLRHRTDFADWTANRGVESLGTNAGAQSLPFQNWRRFKEAFAPELVSRAINKSDRSVRRCIDPFGGSGTTGLACQFLGVHPILAEVNPYLADLIEAKLTQYASVESLKCDLVAVIEASARDFPADARAGLVSAPSTFVEPGRNGKWIFDGEVAERIVALRDAIGKVDDPSRRLFRVILGGILIDVSNVVVSGKGRRYRTGWRDRVVSPRHVTEGFYKSARRAIDDIDQFASRSGKSYEIIRGDSRVALNEVEPCQLAVFSPPYPNSADYTDIYNVELWSLGYLSGPAENALLRLSTLSSHVQRSKPFAPAPAGSPTLARVLEHLESRRCELWDRRIPSMIGAYFGDLIEVLDSLSRILTTGGTSWMVVGDSRYAKIQIPVADILEELAQGRGWEVLSKEPFRSMRTSAQQGGERMLPEQLLVLRNAR